jgi:hypothetical protein
MNTVNATSPTSSRTGYTYLGWYTTASGGSQIYTASNGLQNVSGFTAGGKFTITTDITLYAHWDINCSITVSGNNFTTNCAPGVTCKFLNNNSASVLVNSAGTYTLNVSDAEGRTKSCSKTVVNASPDRWTKVTTTCGRYTTYTCSWNTASTTTTGACPRDQTCTSGTTNYNGNTGSTDCQPHEGSCNGWGPSFASCSSTAGGTDAKVTTHAPYSEYCLSKCTKCGALVSGCEGSESCYEIQKCTSHSTYYIYKAKTCSCSANNHYGYEYNSPRTSTDQTECTNANPNCTSRNHYNNGNTRVECTPTRWACSSSQGTLINNKYCYK